MTRTPIIKTYKLFIGGAFPRTESGRSMLVNTPTGEPLAHLCRASRKDLRQAVEAAHKAQPGWAGASAYNRGQILYRMAEMLESRHAEFVETLCATTRGRNVRAAAQREVDGTIDRLVAFAGWSDKFTSLMGTQNPVPGPYYVFSTPEPVGVLGVAAPKTPGLLGLISLIAPAICAGNAVIALASTAHPLPAVVFGEVCATSDLPGGVVNLLTGHRDELLPHFAAHRGIDGIIAAGLSAEERSLLEAGAAENLKRVRCLSLGAKAWSRPEVCESIDMLEPMVEIKTIWHPSAV